MSQIVLKGVLQRDDTGRLQRCVTESVAESVTESITERC